MTEHYYLYALTSAECGARPLGAGVDPRFDVELVPCGRLAALASRVGLDQFDVSKLEEGTADLDWLGKVAIRHNEIIEALAKSQAVLPMRLGILYESRDSLVARLMPYEAEAAEFLRMVADRQEWGVKVYLDERAVRETATVSPIELAPGTASPEQTAAQGKGATYLAARSRRIDQRRQVGANARQAIPTVETVLSDIAETWTRLRPLAQSITDRPDKMVWNAAFLVHRSAVDEFLAACDRLHGEFESQGLAIEVTGPWPAYHFCPAFEPQSEDSSCR